MRPLGVPSFSRSRRKKTRINQYLRRLSRQSLPLDYTTKCSILLGVLNRLFVELSIFKKKVDAWGGPKLLKAILKAFAQAVKGE